jgi:hypothetical protein
MEEFLFPCINKQLTGLECYGCGAQRATLMLIRGNFFGALIMFPAIYPILMLLVFSILDMRLRFKYAFQIKISLILISATVVLVSYLYKLVEFLN